MLGVAFGRVVAYGAFTIVKPENLCLLFLCEAVFAGQPDRVVVKTADARAENIQLVGDGVQVVGVYYSSCKRAARP